tara:strand:+ start:462 stop:869 length:408 start_codon:yes stop_codon:yes gene_type:complete
MVKREGKLEKEILLLGGVALVVIVGLELYKNRRSNKSTQLSKSKFGCPDGQKKVPLMRCMAMTPECLNAPSFKCVDENSPHAKFSNAAGRGVVRSSAKPLKDILTIPLCCLWNKKCCKDIKGPFRQINNTLYPTR